MVTTLTPNISKLIRLLSGIFAFILISGCVSLKNTEEMKPIISMKKTPCYGTCPEYELNIYSNGIATIDAQRFLKIEGSHYAKIKKKDLRETLDMFEEVGFFQFKDEYNGKMSDLPTTYVTYNSEGKSKTIKDYYGSPASLKDLQKHLGEYVKSLNWKEME